MFGLGFGELIAIGIILFVFFGAKRLPALGSSLAQGIRNFQKGIKGEVDNPEKIEHKHPHVHGEGCNHDHDHDHHHPPKK
jgi:sec-independent protein translocase protein TatA